MTSCDEDDLWPNGIPKYQCMQEGVTIEDYWGAPYSISDIGTKWMQSPEDILAELVGEIMHLRDENKRLNNEVDSYRFRCMFLSNDEELW